MSYEKMCAGWAKLEDEIMQLVGEARLKGVAVVEAQNVMNWAVEMSDLVGGKDAESDVSLVKRHLSSLTPLQTEVVAIGEALGDMTKADDVMDGLWDFRAVLS